MFGKKRESIRAVSLAEVKEILKKRSEEPDFGYEQQTSYDYVNKHCKLNLEDARLLHAELEKIEELSNDSIVKIVDILPKYKSTLQAILAKEKLKLSDSQLDSIIESVSKAREKMIDPPVIAPKEDEETKKEQED